MIIEIDIEKPDNFERFKYVQIVKYLHIFKTLDLETS